MSDQQLEQLPEEPQPLPLEEQISTELVKHNFTEAKLNEFREYLKLDIIDNDKESYLIIKEKRKECKSYRVAVEKFCKFKREDAVKVQKAWVAKENELVDEISKVEDYLKDKEEGYEKAIAAEKERKKRQQEEQLIMRQQELTNMGVLYSDGNFILGEVSFEMSLIRECDSDIWENDIKPKFEVEYQKIAAERIEQARIKQEREAELKRQEEELKQKQLELAAKEAALKAAQEEQERKEREEHDRRMAAARAQEEARSRARVDQLHALGLKVEFFNNHLYYAGYDCSVSHLDITGYSDEKWDEMIEKITPHIAGMKALEEERRLAEIEAQKEAERIQVLGKSRSSVLRQYNATDSDMQYFPIEELGKMDDERWEGIRAAWQSKYEIDQRVKWEKEQEEKRKLEEQKKVEELLQATEKEKWADIIKQINAIEIHEFKSGQYRKRYNELIRLLDQIKAL